MCRFTNTMTECWGHYKEDFTERASQIESGVGVTPEKLAKVTNATVVVAPAKSTPAVVVAQAKSEAKASVGVAQAESEAKASDVVDPAKSGGNGGTPIS